MAFQAETNLSCPVCHGIFQDPVLLSCSHSFCRACWQRCWTVDQAHLCPVCRQRCWQSDPPRNLALRNLCEDFLAERARTPPARAEPRCSLHGETLRLFCLDDQQLVCVVCLPSEIHNNHIIRPIDEAAWDYKSGLQCSLEDLRQTLELFNDVKRNFDQTEQDIEVQATDTERQIKDMFSRFQQLLQQEEETRITALRQEKQQKSQMLRGKIEMVNTEIAALSSTITATEEALQAENLRFLSNYQTTAERVQQQPVSDVPESISGALLDTSKHLNNLTSVILVKMREEMLTSSSEVLQPTTKPKQYRLTSPEKLELINDIEKYIDLLVQNVEVQAQDTEKQIKDMFSMFQQFLQEEEKIRIDKVRESKQQESQRWKSLFEILDDQTSRLSEIIVMASEAQGFNTIHHLLYTEHLYYHMIHEHIISIFETTLKFKEDIKDHNNLHSVILDKMQEMVTSNSQILQPIREWDSDKSPYKNFLSCFGCLSLLTLSETDQMYRLIYETLKKHYIKERQAS